MKPFISVCIPVYNVKNFIRDCLESVINQEFQNFEINLVDNGSDDGTTEICEEYAKKYTDKIKFYKFSSPTIIGRAFRRTFVMSKGEYIIYLDSDDYLLPGYFQNIYEQYVFNKQDLYMIDYEILFEDGITERQKNSFDETGINNLAYEEAVKYIVSNNTFLFALWKCVYRRESLGDIFLETPNIEMPNSDVYMQLMFFLKARSIYYIKKSFYVYRLRSSSVSNSTITSEKVKHLLVALLVMFDLVNYKTRFDIDSIKEFTMPFIRRYMKIVIGNFHLINEEDLKYISKYIDENNLISSLEQYSEKWIISIKNNLLKLGILNGINYFFDFEKQLFLKDCEKAMCKNVYVFPTGAYGECSAQLLNESGYNVLGFLDNSKLKEGKIIAGIKCYNPSYILLNNEFEDIIVVIASVYDEYKELMIEQIVNIGLKKENIIVRDIDNF